MTARLFVREVGQREFVVQGDFDTTDTAQSAGETLCVSGNVEAFEVWELIGSYERQWTLRKTGGE